MDNRSEKRAIWITLLLVVLSLGGCALFFLSAAKDPGVALLLPEGGAEWIIANEPLSLQRRDAGYSGTVFRKTVRVDSPSEGGVLTFKAMKDAIVELDGITVRPLNKDHGNWKEPVSVDLGPRLTPGEHELRIMVINLNGPQALLAYGTGLGVSSSIGWEASRDGVAWEAARRADEPRFSGFSEIFRAPGAFVSSLPLLLPIFFITFFWTLAYYRKSAAGRDAVSKFTPGPGALRWLIMAAWVALAINNFSKMPVNTGFDGPAHLDYIRFVAERLSIPYANDGWQMFQSPLYYMASAPFFLILGKAFDPDTVVRVLKFIPLLCGLLQVEITYRAMKLVFPERTDLQAIGVVIGGLLPANIYISLSLGNESMAGAFSAATLAAGLWILRGPTPVPRKRALLLGTFLGLALLSKVTAVLLVPPLVLLLVYKGRNGVAGVAGTALISGTAAFAISSWYYIRNWLKLGSAFVGGWDPSREIVWWQDPGYRTLRDFYAFGKSLTAPVYSGLNGFWDSFYSSLWLDGFVSGAAGLKSLPPWNYDIMLSSAWLSVLPTLAIIIASAAALLRPARSLEKGTLFSAIFLAVYIGALASLFMKLPIFSTTKASYTIGLTPAYAVLCASGLGILMRTAFLRAVAYGWIACWAAFAYMSYLAW